MCYGAYQFFLMVFNTSFLSSSPKTVVYSLTFYFGLGRSLALQICKRFGLSPVMLSIHLSKSKLFRLSLFLDNKLVLDNKLKLVEAGFLKKLSNNKSYRGIRLMKGLPVRGQRTHSNGKTQKKIKRFF